LRQDTKDIFHYRTSSRQSVYLKIILLLFKNLPG